MQAYSDSRYAGMGSTAYFAVSNESNSVPLESFVEQQQETVKGTVVDKKQESLLLVPMYW